MARPYALRPAFASAFALASLALAPGPAWAEDPADGPEPPGPAAVDAPAARDASYASRKEAILDRKSHTAQNRDVAADEKAKQRWQRQLDRRVGQPPGAVINIYNTWTHEYLSVDAASVSPDLSDQGPAPVPAVEVDRFLRCHYTNQPTDMDPRLVRVLVAAARHFGVDRVDIVSAFRSPKYNRVLRKKGREVSRNSQHPQGTAVDFRLPGVSVKRLHAWARSLRLGGVGFYPHSAFIHVDTARVRYWTGR